MSQEWPSSLTAHKAKPISPWGWVKANAFPEVCCSHIFIIYPEAKRQVKMLSMNCKSRPILNIYIFNANLETKQLKFPTHLFYVDLFLFFFFFNQTERNLNNSSLYSAPGSGELSRDYKLELLVVTNPSGDLILGNRKPGQIFK